MDKELIKEGCLDIVNLKLESIQKAIDGYKNDLVSESKSSAGDKHETGRAMLQLEMEKLGEQYQKVLTQKNTLSKINISSSSTVGLGSLVLANGFYYFLATSIGQVTINNDTIMVISIKSPIGKQLLGKKIKETISFNGKLLTIENVA